MVSLYRAVSRYNNQYLGKLEPVTYPRKNHETITRQSRGNNDEAAIN